MKSLKIFALAFAVVALSARAETTPVEEPKEVITLVAETEQGEFVTLNVTQNESGELVVVKEADIAC
jgi:hypothetical protein